MPPKNVSEDQNGEKPRKNKMFYNIHKHERLVEKISCSGRVGIYNEYGNSELFIGMSESFKQVDQ